MRGLGGWGWAVGLGLILGTVATGRVAPVSAQTVASDLPGRPAPPSTLTPAPTVVLAEAEAVPVGAMAPARVPTLEALRGRLGLILPAPYVRGKIPVVFVHGLGMGPSAWLGTIEQLRADATLEAQFQFWTFGYATGDPLPYAALLLRHALGEVRRSLDPEQTDVAWDQMVLVGHSMGGLLAKMQVVRTDDRLWSVLCPHPPAELRGDLRDRQFLTDSLIFGPRTEVRRVVFIATPHRGSRADAGSLNRLGHRLVRVTEVPLGVRQRLIDCNGADFFTDAFTRRRPTSIEDLRTDGPLLAKLVDLPISPTVQAHSIIAVRPDAHASVPTDGIVALESARLAGVASEKVVRCGHILALDDAEVHAEVRRILRVHLDEITLAVR